MPRWREWANGWTRGAYSDYRTKVAGLAIHFAGDDCEKWSEICRGIFYVDGTTSESAISCLEELAVNEKNEDARKPLWDAIRRSLVDHQEKSEEELFQKLANVRDTLEPKDVVLNNAWLFDRQAYFEFLRDKSVEDNGEEHGKRQVQALKAIFQESGVEGIDKLLELSDGGNNIGWMLGANNIVTPTEIDLRKRLSSESETDKQFARGFTNGAFQTKTFEFLDDLPIEEWDDAEVVQLATCFSFNEKTWKWLDRFGSNVNAQYWQDVVVQPWRLSEAEYVTATTSLLSVGRGFDAIDTMHAATQTDGITVKAEAIAKVLEMAAALNVRAPSRERSVRYELQELIKKVQEEGNFDQARLAKIELTYLGVFDSANHRMQNDIRPVALTNAIWDDPDFFVGLVTTVYRGKGEERKEITEEQRLIARRSYDVLEKIEQLPLSDSGEPDLDSFHAWVEVVRAKLTAVKRLSVTDSLIGQIVARSTYSKKGEWPEFNVAQAIESIATDKLISGFVAQVVNLRGITSRGPTDGGQQERDLADRYKNLAERIRPYSQNLAGAFQTLADGYLREAKREDEEAKRERWGQ